MLHLSARCRRHPGRWEDTLREAVRRTIYWPSDYFGSMVEYYPISVPDQSRHHLFGKKVICINREENLERRYSGCRH